METVLMKDLFINQKLDSPKT